MRDLQRFLRLGFAHRRCLLGVTLSFRQYKPAAYPPGAPTLTLDDLVAFVAAEARNARRRSSVLETVKYGMVFVLFLLEEGL